MTDRRYTLEFRPAAVRQLRKLPKDAQRRLRAATESLRQQPRPPGAGKLAGTDDLWRIRVGDFRIVYTITDEALVITVVGSPTGARCIGASSR